MATALELHEQLIAGLLRTAAYPEPVDSVERIDTHISTVLLAGTHAYKIKKPVDLGFVDYTTTERRRHYCSEEVRLNRRTAPKMYLDVAPIFGPRSAARIGRPSEDDHAALEYAVRMLRFDPHRTLDRLAANGQLTTRHVERLATAVAQLHGAAQVAPEAYGTAALVGRWADENLAALRNRTHSADERARLDSIARWAAGELQALLPRFEARRAAGRIRECHGDLHLGNVVLLDEEPVIFDAIEFNDELQMIDVFSDVAFTFMDLADRGPVHYPWRFVGAYCEDSGDYQGLPLLRYYAVYRALVRANVALIRLQQPNVLNEDRLHQRASFEHHLALAERLHAPGRALLITMTGLSGSGKSMVAQLLAERIGGVRVRSDVERKRLFGLAPNARSDGRIYGADATARTYARLAEVAQVAISARVPVILDAAFLRRDERAQMRALAAQLGATFALVVCEAPADVLRSRIAARAAEGGDASEADLEVLERQFGWREPLADDERGAAVIETTGPLEEQVDALAARLLESATV